MTHRDFVEGYRDGRVKVYVDKSMVLRIADSGGLPRQYWFAHALWSWMSLLCMGTTIAAFIWWPWYWGVGFFMLTMGLAGAIRTTASDFVIDHAIKHAEFYDMLLRAQVLRVERVPHSVGA
jgi:hypothetical protein